MISRVISKTGRTAFFGLSASLPNTLHSARQSQCLWNTSSFESTKLGAIAGKTSVANFLSSKYPRHAQIAFKPASRQGTKPSPIARINAGKINFALAISLKFGATFPIKITIFVRILSSESPCNRTKYRVNFSKFAGVD